MKTLKEIRKDLKNLNGESFKLIHSKVWELTIVEIGFKYPSENELAYTDERLTAVTNYLDENNIPYDITILVDSFVQVRFFDEFIQV